jgi:hypothetical protein
MKTILISTALFSLCSFSNLLLGQSTYEYPIKPGTEEWKQLKNHKEKVEVCQIPENIIHSLTTEELLDVCLYYPLIGDIMAFNNIQDGFDAFKSNFNGANELLHRNEFPSILLERYSKIEPANYENEWSNIKKGEYAYKIMVLEFFIAQDEVLCKLDIDKKKDIVRLLLSKKEEKKKNEIYDYHSIMSIYYPISRILFTEEIDKTIINDELASEIMKFSKSGNMNNMRLLPYIDSMAFSFIK